ncbi:MAG: helix-turn-helix transcriptional regulator [Lachnospiraceae bacterium]|nr:helix-turn-helix transcriptional regulator [Lachnospiraceae bacterium]
MEKKTIGSFIAVLRKANGLTQKQLAEMLQVTDKTVSRWERDETLPDLTLIPVIAEIFGVTSDELLRGERRTVISPGMRESKVISEASVDDDNKDAEYNGWSVEKIDIMDTMSHGGDTKGKPSPSATLRGEKQIQRILSNTRTKYQIHCIITLFLAVIGLVAVIGCIEGFTSGHGIDRGSLGLAVGLIIHLSAIAHQIVYAMNAYMAIDSDEFGKEAVEKLKKHIVSRALLLISLVVCLFTEALVIVAVGFGDWEWLLLTCIWEAVMIVVCLMLAGIVKARFRKKGIFHNRKP